MVVISHIFSNIITCENGLHSYCTALYPKDWVATPVRDFFLSFVSQAFTSKKKFAKHFCTVLL